MILTSKESVGRSNVMSSLRTPTRLRCSGKIGVGMNCASKAPNPMQLVFRLSYLSREGSNHKQGGRENQMCLDL